MLKAANKAAEQVTRENKKRKRVKGDLMENPVLLHEAVQAFSKSEHRLRPVRALQQDRSEPLRMFGFIRLRNAVMVELLLHGAGNRPEAVMKLTVKDYLEGEFMVIDPQDNDGSSEIMRSGSQSYFCMTVLRHKTARSGKPAAIICPVGDCHR